MLSSDQLEKVYTAIEGLWGALAPAGDVSDELGQDFGDDLFEIVYEIGQGVQKLEKFFQKNLPKPPDDYD